MGAMRTLVQDVIDLIEAIPFIGPPAGTTLTLSPAAVNSLNIPNLSTEHTFSVTLQTTNTDKFRDRSPSGVTRVGHTLTVSLLCRIFPNNQMEGYLDAIDLEERITAFMLIQSSLPNYRTFYDRTRRTLTSSGEYVLIDIDFDMEQTLKVP